MSSANFRKPKEQHRYRNGFADSNSLAPDSLKEEDAVEAQDYARFVIREMGSHFPPFAEMKSLADAPDTVTSIQERIKRVKTEKIDGIAKLSTYYAQAVDDDAMDGYLQTDDLRYFDDLPKSNEWPEHYARFDSFTRRSRSIQTSKFNDVLERAHYDHLQVMLQLHKRRSELERAEEEARIKRDARFPLSIHEYLSMEFKAARLRVARFLMADGPRREQMRTESRWAWRQTEPLIREYVTNSEFHREIEKLVRENESRDPRNRQI